MTDYTFTSVLVWDSAGGSVKLARRQQVSVIDPNTGLTAAGLKQAGQPVSAVIADDSGRVSFTATVPVVRLVTARGFTQDVPSNDLWSAYVAGGVPFAASGEVSTTKAVRADDARLSDARAPKLETLLGTTDLDTITTPGFYLQDTSANATAARHYPEVTAGHLYVQANPTSTHVVQAYTIHHASVPVTYMRTRFSGAWSPWQIRPTVNVASSTNLDNLTVDGAYRVVGFSTANSLTPALPLVATGLLEVFAQGTNMIQRWSTSGNPPNNQVWQREKNGSTWGSWRRLDMPVIYWEKDGNLSTSTDLTTLTAGAWEVFSSTTATALALPVAAGGVLEVFVVGTGGVQRYSTFGSPQQIWQRENNNGTWTSWRRLDAPPPTPTFSTSLPDYAAPRTHTWNPALCLYNGESDVLRRLRKAITASRHKGTAFRLVAIGDSKTTGAGVTAGHYSETDSYPGQLLDLFSASMGIIYAGNAYAHWSANTGWVAPAGFDTNYLQATAGTPATITLTLVTACTGVKVYAQADATATISVTVDGGAPTVLTVAAGSSFTGQSITGLTDATHTLVITTSSTVRLMGVEQLYSTPRLTITNGGRSGSDASHWNDTATNKLWATNVTAAAPDALIVNIGTNTGATTPPDIVAVIARAAGLGIPVLIAAFGGIARSTLYDGKRDALYDAADTYDLPLVDFTIVIGDNTTATAAGLMSDSLHENERGYALEAAAVARATSF